MFWFETWAAGNQHTGIAAAFDDRWVGPLHETLLHHWRAKTEGQIDHW
jgi:hypothetical protein